MLLDGSNLSADVLARAAVILGVLVLLLFSSTTSIYIILRNLNDATNFYLVSCQFEFAAHLVFEQFVRKLPSNF